MKKIYFALILASVSSIALAQEISATEQIVEMVKRNVMSAGVAYQEEPTVKTIANGFEVSVPAGVINDSTQTIPAFSFPLTEDGTSGSNKRYVMKLDKLAFISPMLEQIVSEQKITYSNANYVAKFIPQIGLVESQEMRLNGLNMPFENNNSASVASVYFKDTAEMLSDTKIKQEDTISLRNIKLMHPLASLAIQSFDVNVSVPETQKAATPIEQAMKTPFVRQKMSIKGVKLSSAVAGQDKTLGFNLNQSLDVRQNPQTYNMTADFKINIDSLQMTGLAQLPSDISIDMTATGFTLMQVMDYSAVMEKIQETQGLPESPTKGVVLEGLNTQADKAIDALMANMKIDVNEVSVKQKEYALVLKGQLVPKDEHFKGTLQVTNFEYLAPEPRKVDEAKCQQLVNEMLENKIQGDAFKEQYAVVCDEGRGILDGLRPFASTAQKVKDITGKDALLFSVESRGDDMFINGQKVETDDLLDPTQLMGN